MTNIVEQLFKSLDPWPGFHITGFEKRVSPIDGKKTLLLRLEATAERMPICSHCRQLPDVSYSQRLEGSKKTINA